MKLYHGTNRDFESIDLKKSNYNTCLKTVVQQYGIWQPLPAIMKHSKQISIINKNEVNLNGSSAI